VHDTTLQFQRNTICLHWGGDIPFHILRHFGDSSVFNQLTRECDRQQTLTKPSIKTFLQTGGDNPVHLDSPGWLPYTEMCRNLILAWTTFQNLLPIMYYGFVGLRTTLVHATDDDDEPEALCAVIIHPGD